MKNIFILLIVLSFFARAEAMHIITSGTCTNCKCADGPNGTIILTVTCLGTSGTCVETEDCKTTYNCDCPCLYNNGIWTDGHGIRWTIPVTASPSVVSDVSCYLKITNRTVYPDHSIVYANIQLLPIE